MATRIIPQSEDIPESFDQFGLEEWAKGWDANARSMGNRRATRRPPVPGFAGDYYQGFNSFQKMLKRGNGRKR